ncbi:MULTISPECIES: hypothetical protein [Burkholderia]|uniref:hypothetical protein n=1 Tax=Burkholderia TaxID=32008 RepID=UPI00064E978B|nr:MULTISPECIES: hypothetical protein [Burkholderia]KML15959.1 hypothetical protein VL00_13760 [Burkholderia cepacia]KML42218.1 hypothetical protein VL13_11105 [Burkholderia lata]KMN62264.1 hypothetical protein VK92_02885 [Burkholderia sp. LK4]
MPDVNLQPLVDQAWATLHPLLTTVLSGTLIATLASTGLVAWITAKAKGRVDAHYAQTLERLKAALKGDADTKLEALKSQLKSEGDTKLEILKSELKSESDSRIESHKADLKRSGDTEMEKLRAQLAAANAERNTLLAALAQRRFDAIAAVHAPLLKFHRALKEVTSGFRPVGANEEAMLDELVRTSNAFDEVFVERQIFLTEATADMLEDIRQKLIANGVRFQHAVMLNVNAPDRPVRWMEIEATVRGPLGRAIRELQHELRALMGDKPPITDSAAPAADSSTD